MKIALLHFRVYETDGVSLEMEKWRIELTNLGHDVVYISGTKPKKDDLFIKELDYKSDYNKLIHKNSFEEFCDYKTKEDLLQDIKFYANKIELELIDIINTNKIDLIIPNNVSSLGFNIPAGIAIGNIAKKNIVEIIYHHHDFHWERSKYSTPLFVEIQELLDTYFPYPNNAKHCVINHIAQHELFQRTGVKATVVPNVFDFSDSSWIIDSYNSDLRSKYNISKNDIVFLQSTRIVERKAIEIAYDVINEFSKNLHLIYGQVLYNGNEINKDTKIHFVLAGLQELSSDKFNILNKHFDSSEIKIHYINDIVDHTRRYKNNNKIYSLWDIYTMCDIVTYTSVLEGWGNQLLEAVFAKKPILIYEYPVFKTDIKKFGFNLIRIDAELTKNEITNLFSVKKECVTSAATEIKNILLKKSDYMQSVFENFEIGKSNLSYSNLKAIISSIISKDNNHPNY